MNDDAKYHNIKGKIRWNTGHHEEALKEFDIAIQLDPNNTEYHSNKYKALILLGRKNEALNELQVIVLNQSKKPIVDDVGRRVIDNIKLENLSGKSRETLINEYVTLNEKLDEILKETSFDSVVKYVYNRIESVQELSDLTDRLGMAFEDKATHEMRLSRYTPQTVISKLIIERACELGPTTSTIAINDDSYSTLFDVVYRMFIRAEEIEFRKQQFSPDFSAQIRSQRIAMIEKLVNEKAGQYDNTENLLKTIKEGIKHTYSEYPFYEKFDIALMTAFGFTMEQYILIMRTFIEFSLDHKENVIKNVPVKNIDNEEELMFATKATMEDPDKSPEICFSDLDGLVKYSEKLVGFEQNIIKNVIEFSTLNIKRSQSTANHTELWKTGTKINRLAIKPIIRLSDGRLLFGINTLIAALKIFNIRISTGKWMYNRELLPDKLREALEHIEKDTATEFEISVYDVIRSMADICKRNLFRHKNSNEEFLSTIGTFAPGEIDILSIHTSKRLIILWEVKYLLENFGMRENLSDLDEFEKDYIVKVNKKINFIKNNLVKVLGFYKISKDDGWEVKAYFVLPQESLLQLMLKYKTNDIEFVTFEKINNVITK